MSVASLIAAASRPSRGAMASTSPSVRASSAATGLDCSIMCTALGTPTSRGRRCVPPNPGMTPNWSSGSPSCAPGVATRALHAMATSSPPPRARLSMAATVGLAPASTRPLRTTLKSAMFATGFPSVRALSCVMSNPPLNLPLLPVMTIARTRASPCAASSCALRPTRTGMERAFTGGLLSSITATWSRISMATGAILRLGGRRHLS
mmetsp:Transcript_18318/g.45628  ORF Transcript_18318/g.45628 Transcript_18318/m.45628 type:complete len:207 (+) Transcript_18318:1622-2242(+)